MALITMFPLAAAFGMHQPKSDLGWPTVAFRSVAVAQDFQYPSLDSLAVSRDGRFIAFESLAQLLPLDTNPVSDIYLLSIDTGHLELVSVGPDGRAVNESSSKPRLSGDGRFVVFESITLQPQPPCGTVFLRDRERAATRALVRPRSNPPDIECAARPAISDDGQWVAFESSAALVTGLDANGAHADVYVMNTHTDHIARVSVASDGTQSSIGSSYSPTISGAGRVVAFTSTACLDRPSAHRARLTNGDLCKPQIYVRDLTTGVTSGIRTPRGGPPNGPTYGPALSGSGEILAFVSTATNLAQGDTNERPDVYALHVASGSIELLSRNDKGTAGNAASSRPAISESGRFVVFESMASDLICRARCPSRDHDHNLVSDVFLVDRGLGLIRRLSQEPDGQPWWEPSLGAAIDGAGRLVTFSSRHAQDAADIEADFDLFVMIARPPNHRPAP